MEPVLTIRKAAPDDSALILFFIRSLAAYEKMLSEVTATEDDIRRSLFEEKGAEVLIGEFEGEPVGFALFFENYSTFLGKKGIHLEDLFVLPKMRGKGFGKALLRAVAGETVKRNGGRLEWACLDWNAPSIAFYRSMGATPLSDWTTFRLTGESLQAVSQLNNTHLRRNEHGK